MGKLIRDIRKDLRKYRSNFASRYPVLAVRKITAKAAIGVKTILYSALVKSETRAGAHSVQLRIEQVNFKEQKDRTTTKRTNIAGRPYHYTAPSISKNPVAVKCSCFTKDTQVILHDGKVATFEQLQHQSEVRVLSYDGDAPVVAEAFNPRITRKLAPVMEVFFSSGASVRCTHDHIFFTKDMKEVEAVCLQPGDKLLASGLPVEVDHVVPLCSQEDVYCLTVPKYARFFINVAKPGEPILGVLVHNCEDYRFSFEKQNFDRKSNVGNWRRYKRLTPPPVRPARPKNPNPIGRDFVNPDNFQGYCKHIHSLIKTLEKKKELRP